MSDDLVDVLVLALEALDRAHSELEMLAETDVPTPDVIERRLREHAGACAVLRRVLRAAPPERRRRLAAMIREEMAAHEADYAGDMGKVPVLPEVLTELADVQQAIRRRRLSDRALDDLLRGVVLVSEYADC